MELFVHGGLNKTGTSYLQVWFEVHAARLRTSGIGYADSQAGFGNAAQICYALRRGDQAALRSQLTMHRRAAEAAGCGRVLLSSELFYHDIIRPERRARLLEAVDAVGLECPQLLLIFREPVAHAVSCFCHRSGTRELEVFEDWIARQYEFPRELRLFFVALDAGLGMDLTAIPYSSHRLEPEVCRWLGIAPLPAISQTVNSSVTAFEARILSWLRQSDPAAALRVRDRLKALDPALKHPDVALRSHWQSVAAAALVPFAADLERLGTLLGRPMTCGETQGPGPDRAPVDEVRLSRDQVNAIVEASRARDSWRVMIQQHLAPFRRWRRDRLALRKRSAP